MKKSLLVTAFLSAIPLFTQAQSTWNTATGNWNTPGNWLPVAIPVSGSTTALTFGGNASYTATNNIGANFQLNSLSLTNTAGRVTIAGSSLNFVSNGGATPTISHTTVGTEATTISSDVVLSNDLGISATGSSSFDWLTFSGVVSGAGKLSITTGGGNYFVILSNSGNSYSGGTTVSGGLKTAAGGALGSGLLTLGGNGKWVISTATQSHANDISLNGTFTIDANASATLSGNVALGANQLTLRTSAGSPTSTISGVISGAGNLIKGDAGGTWILSGNNSYAGTTAVNAGTLLINGNQSLATGNVSVAATGTLGGNGTIGGAVTVANSGFLAPGTTTDTTSTLALNNRNLTLSGADSKVAMDLTGTGAGDFDRVTGIASFTMNGDITLTLAGSYTTASWDLFDFASKTGNFDSITLAGSYTGSLTRSGDTWTGTVGGQDWTFEQTTGVLSVIPEPSTSLSLIAGIGTLLMCFRRRHMR
jgi:autotransporter-associated beta strand protein